MSRYKPYKRQSSRQIQVDNFAQAVFLAPLITILKLPYTKELKNLMQNFQASQ